MVSFGRRHELEKRRKLLITESTLANDRAQRADWQRPVSVHRHNNQARGAGLAKVMVAATDMGQVEARSLQSRYDLPAAGARQPIHAMAISTSVSSTGVSESATSRCSFSAASR